MLNLNVLFKNKEKCSITWKNPFYELYAVIPGFPGGSVIKYLPTIVHEAACNAGDPGLSPQLGRSPREGKGNSVQYPCLGNPTDKGAWGYNPWVCNELNMIWQLNHHQQ